MKQLISIALGAIGIAAVIKWLSEDESNELPIRRIFLSHSWEKGREEYNKFVKKMKRDGIEFYNHSIPEEKAFDATTKKELRKIFRKQMTYCSKIYVLAKNGTSPDSFVGMEIEIAKELGKPVIAVKPNGQYGIPKFIRDNADMVISNNITSIQRTLK